MSNVEDPKLYSAMHEGKPYSSYKKTVLAKVYVTRLNTFSGSPEGLILEGDPKKGDKSASIDVWSQREDEFFKQANDKHLANGTLVPFIRKEEVPVKLVEQSTDEELTALLNTKYFSLQSKLNAISTTPVLYRLLDLAAENEKSDKITKLIEARISEIQTSEVTSKGESK